MLSSPTFGDTNISTVLHPMLGNERSLWLPLAKSTSMPRIGTNAYKVVYSKQENSWLLDTLTQLSSIALIPWPHTMITGHGKISMRIIDKIHYELIVYYNLYDFTRQRRSKGRYGSLHWTTIQILDGALLSPPSFFLLAFPPH